MNTKKTSHNSGIKHVMQYILVILVVFGLLGSTVVYAHPPGITEWVEVSSDGTGANSQGELPAISADGRFVAFASRASNLVPDDTNNAADVFVHDRLTGITERVSVDSRGRQGDNDSGLFGPGAPAISADGRFVAFTSLATNLVRPDRNSLSISDIFVHDRLNGTTELVSVSSTGEQADDDSSTPAISADGRYIAFQSFATTLVPGDTNFVDDIFVHDRLAGTTERVSVSSAGGQANGSSIFPDISPDGRFVVFSSSADNLVPGSQSIFNQVFLHDRATGTIELISQDVSGNNAGNGNSVFPSVSADGLFVAFESNAHDLVTDVNTGTHIYVRDRQAEVTELVSKNSAGEPASLPLSGKPDITADGRFVTFFSVAENLVSGDTNNRRDIFVRDLQTGAVVRVSVSTAGEQGNSESTFSQISDDGLVVAFKSNSNNLVPGVNGGLFVHDDRPAADLSVAKSDSPDPVITREALTYSIVVTNNGPGSALNVQLSDLLPANVPFVSASTTAGNCVQTDSTVVCDLGDLSNGASVTVTIIVAPRRVGTIVNTAHVSSLSPDPNSANNTDTEETIVVR